MLEQPPAPEPIGAITHGQERRTQGHPGDRGQVEGAGAAAGDVRLRHEDPVLGHGFVSGDEVRSKFIF